MKIHCWCYVLEIKEEVLNETNDLRRYKICLPIYNRAREIEFYGGTDTLRKVLRDLGFRFTRVDGRRYISEKPSVAAKRAFFLRQYVDLCRTGKYDFVFLDETWIFQKGSQKTKSWQDVDIKSCPTRGVDTGSRYIVLHAGGTNGFIDGASL